MEIGLRVVRGPDWMWGDQDGGEGNAGTVVQLGQDGTLPDGTVLVYWDSGKQANYRAGHSGKFDLRVYDNAPTGVKHIHVTCDGCKQFPIAGTRWKCADCPNYDLCSPCYMSDVHNKQHSFLRFDENRSDGIPVGKRSNYTKRQSKGLFPGARVIRGRDWKWAEQDGGSGRTGALTELTAWNGVERAGAKITWNVLSRNTYRTGYMGSVDVKCSTPATGPSYYRECLAKVGETRRRPDANRLRVGDRVSVCLDAEVLKAMSAGHGGWIDDMAQCIGKVGTISKIDADGDVHISYGLQSWVFHPDAVTKIASFQAGDQVRVKSDKQLVQNLQQGHGGWNESMSRALGKEGKILEVDSDGDAVVLVGSDLWLMNPAALEDLSGGEASSRRGDTSPSSPGDRTADLLKLLLLQAVMKGGGGEAGDRLVNASSNGNFQDVREILEANPGKIDHKRGGKTALHVACHQGRTEIVKYLLGKGADKDIKDEQDYTALHHAAYGDRSGETVTVMLNTGTNVNVCDNKNKSTPLHLAVNQGNEAGVRALLTSRHCDVNRQDLAGDTSLHDAISKDKNTIVDLILRSQVLDVTVCNGRRFNPLHQACMKGNLHAVQKIVEKYPGLIKIPKEDGFTALHLSAFNNHIEIVRCLLLTGHCPINQRNSNGQTALALAVSEAYTAMTELLIEHGADVNAADEDGNTPLHLAFIHQAVGTTGLRGLLQDLGLNLPAGAETDQHTGSTIAVYLALHGANINLYNHDGKTPLDLCPDTQTANLIQQFARNVARQTYAPRPSTFTQPRPQPVLLKSVPRPSAAAAATASAAQRQRKTQDAVNRAESAGTDCIVCSENTATVTFNPCGHKVTCSGCSLKLKRCLKCNAAIHQKTAPEETPIDTPTLMDETDYVERIRVLESRFKAREYVSQCQICMERNRNMFFLCGHSACEECSERLQICHVCRQTIQDRIKILDSSSTTTVPPEIKARGPRARLAFKNALKTGKVKVYRARIMLIGQDRAGKTSLKKSLLGLPFDPNQQSTEGIEVDPSKFKVQVDQVKNWQRTDEKLDVSQFVRDIARMVAEELKEEEEEKKKHEQNDQGGEEKREKQLPEQDQCKQTEESSLREVNLKINRDREIDANQTEKTQERRGDPLVANQSEDRRSATTEWNIDPDLPSEEFTDLLVQHLRGLKLQTDGTTMEHHVTIDLWDFAGQHLYYASYPAFLSSRALYMLVYNLSKGLKDTAQPCFKQGVREIHLSNPNDETNLENLLSWLVSVSTMCSSNAEMDGNKESRNDVPYNRPPVFIVGTHADKPHEEIKEMELQIQKEISGKDYEGHVIRPLFSVDNTQGSSSEGVSKLQKRMIEVLKQEPHMGEEVPLRWFNFEKVVQALVAKKTYHLNLEQLQTIIQRVCYIENEDEVVTMLDFYHDLGMIVRHRNTVVLQAQWLIDVFKQLITIRSFNNMEPKHSKLWKAMETTGTLSMELVDHVFYRFCQEGLSREDILNMMEQFGLIVKFATSPTSERYFVPCQLRTPPEDLCRIEPSPSDPCPLYLHFLGGFVPHGLFSQLVSRCTKWCSESGFKQPPNLFDRAARFFIEKGSIHQLILVCKKRFIKIVLKQMKRKCKVLLVKAEVEEVTIVVRRFLEDTMQNLLRELPWLKNLTYELCVECPYCPNHEEVSCTDEDSMCLLQVPSDGLLSYCPNSYCDEILTLPRLEKWFSMRDVSKEEVQIFAESKKVSSCSTSQLPESMDHPVAVKEGCPSDDELEGLSRRINDWKPLGRRLKFNPSELTALHKDNEEWSEKAYAMLIAWKEREGSAATYQVLFEALCHEFVNRTDLAEKFCCSCEL